MVGFAHTDTSVGDGETYDGIVILHLGAQCNGAFFGVFDSVSNEVLEDFFQIESTRFQHRHISLDIEIKLKAFAFASGV